MNIRPHAFSRRQFAQALAPLLFSRLAPGQPATGAARYRTFLDEGWLFGGKLQPGALDGGFADREFEKITIPHIVAKLSWQDWDPKSWEDVFVYRRHFALPAEAAHRRVFVEFDAVMTDAAVSINGHAMPEHQGGYLPFRHEITGQLQPGDNVLAVAVDARWLAVPPDGNPKGPVGVDYLEPGGIIRSVSLLSVPQIFIRDVFAKPVKVLDADRRVEVICTLDGDAAGPIEVRTELRDGARVLSSAEQSGTGEVKLILANLGNIALWDNDNPKLYDVVTTLLVDGKPVHDHRVRIGFREARFETNGFFLNGRRLHLFGLNRHEVYPYVGFAMPRRVMRRDAEILRREFHCNTVRCSHYPQSEAFLDAADELGLMVWEETPGWGYLGDDRWQQIVADNVRDMVLRDRNHPSIVIWGVRVNESRNDVPLYTRTTEIAKTLDGTRPCSGSMTPGSKRTWQEEWKEDVFAFDDYHAEPDGTVGIAPPLPGVPYMLAEAVGQFNYSARKGFDAKYVRTGDVALQQAQAVRHAQAHDRAISFPRLCGVTAWCAFDYPSLVNAHHAIKTPGIADVFRIPKLGAAFYQAQVSPKVQPVIAPAFYWDQNSGPGKNAAIFSNCDRLELFVSGKHVASLRPDRTGHPHIACPPFFCDLTVEGDLRIDGYVNARMVLSRSFSSDPSRDQFLLHADDEELMADGADATRLVFRVADRYGAPRPFATGEVSFEITGPGGLIGDNPFHLADAGGVGAVWIKTEPRRSGRIRVKATHSTMGSQIAEILAK